MADLTLTTFDWVPEVPRGYVHDLRVRLGPGRGRAALSRRERAVWRSKAGAFRRGGQSALSGALPPASGIRR